MLANARAGTEAAFSQLYALVQPRLLRYLRGMAADDAEDVAADAWIDVVRALGRFEGDQQGFVAWVFTIARRKAIDRSRYEARRPTSALLDRDVDDPRSPDIAELAIEAEATETAIAWVRTLPADQAEAILLRVVAGLDLEHVARLMNRSNGAVRVLTHRGLRRLGASLAPQSVREEV